MRTSPLCLQQPPPAAHRPRPRRPTRPTLIACSSTVAAFPGASLRPLHGVCYAPDPSDFVSWGQGGFYPSTRGDYFHGGFDALWTNPGACACCMPQRLPGRYMRAQFAEGGCVGRRARIIKSPSIMHLRRCAATQGAAVGHGRGQPNRALWPGDVGAGIVHARLAGGMAQGRGACTTLCTPRD